MQPQGLTCKGVGSCLLSGAEKERNFIKVGCSLARKNQTRIDAFNKGKHSSFLLGNINSPKNVLKLWSLETGTGISIMLS
jgi:hypothetical protein